MPPSGWKLVSHDCSDLKGHTDQNLFAISWPLKVLPAILATVRAQNFLGLGNAERHSGSCSLSCFVFHPLLLVIVYFFKLLRLHDLELEKVETVIFLRPSTTSY